MSGFDFVLSVKFDRGASRRAKTVNSRQLPNHQDCGFVGNIANMGARIEKYGQSHYLNNKSAKQCGGFCMEVLKRRHFNPDRIFFPNEETFGWYPGTDCVSNDEEPTCDGDAGDTGYNACACPRCLEDGTPTQESCWAYNYRWQLRNCTFRTMIQITVDDELGPGQAIEEAMAKADGCSIIQLRWEEKDQWETKLPKIMRYVMEGGTWPRQRDW